MTKAFFRKPSHSVPPPSVSNSRSKLRNKMRTKASVEIKNGIRILAFITHSVLCRVIKINRFFSSSFYFRIPFQIIIIFLPLNEYHVNDKNKYEKTQPRREKLFGARVGGNHIVLWHNTIIMLLVALHPNNDGIKKASFKVLYLT